MKTRIKNIIILVTALLFVSAGVSFAHDSKSKHHKPPKHFNGFHKKGHDQHKVVPKVHHHYYNFDRRAPHSDWYNRHYKHRRHYRDRYHHREVLRVHHHYHHYGRHAPREEAIVAVKVKEPGFKFAIVVKEPR